MTALASYRQIWRVAILRQPRLLKWLYGLLLAALLVIGIVAASRPDQVLAAAPRILAGTCAFWGTFAWPGLFISTSLTLESGANGRLVPRQRRRLMETTVAGWLLVVACASVAIGSWTAAAPAGLALLAMVSGVIFKPLVLLPAMLLASQWDRLAANAVPAAVLHAFDTVPGQLALAVLELAIGAWLLGRLYPQGGRPASHLALAQATRPEARIRVPQRYLATLQRDCGAADPGALLLHALGPAARWYVQAPALAVLLAVGVAARFWGHWGGTTPGYYMTAFAGMCVMLGTLMPGAEALRRVLLTRRGEQALLRLTPLAGAPGLLNRRLAVQLLRQALCCLAVQSAIFLAALAWLHVHGVDVRLELTLGCVAAQAGLTRLLDDYAALDARRERWTRPFLVAALEAAAAMVISVPLRVSPWWCLIGVAAIVTAWNVQRDWRRMLAAPPAYPAGRLA